MEITAKGLKKGNDEREILICDLRGLKTESDFDKISIGTSNSGVHIEWKKQNFVYNGDYKMRLFISKAELKKIFIETFYKDSLEDIFDLDK